MVRGPKQKPVPRSKSGTLADCITVRGKFLTAIRQKVRDHSLLVLECKSHQGCIVFLIVFGLFVFLCFVLLCAGMKFNLGLGKVIEGWDFGLMGVRQNGIRELLIPSQMAYGSRGVSGIIPPNTTLWFSVEISSVR